MDVSQRCSPMKDGSERTWKRDGSGDVLCRSYWSVVVRHVGGDLTLSRFEELNAYS